MLAVFCFLLSFPAHADSPPVLASIKPVHSLVAGVMEGVGEPGLIVTGQQGPHDAAFKPSQMAALHQARLIFLVGPALELFLEKPLATLPPGITVVRLQDAAGVTRYPYQETHEHEDEHEEHHGIDPHLWLDAKNAIAMVNAIEKALTQQDPSQAGRYQQNADKLRARLGQLDAKLAQQFAKMKKTAMRGIPYIAYHPAYQYFERRYGLPSALPLTMHPEMGMSAAALGKLERQLAKGRLACIFSEPGYHEAIARRLARETGAQIHLLSPEGMAYDAGKELYFQMMNDISTRFLECLSHARR